MNLLVTGAWSGGKNCIAELEEMGHSVRFMQFEKDDLPCAYDWVECVICNGLFLYHPIERFTNLKYIQLTSAGFDRVRSAACCKSINRRRFSERTSAIISGKSIADCLNSAAKTF